MGFYALYALSFFGRNKTSRVGSKTQTNRNKQNKNGETLCEETVLCEILWTKSFDFV